MELTELIPHLLEHAFEDTAYLVPFLFVTYLALEALEHKAGNRAAQLVGKAGAAGPIVGAILGAVPQCGFSAAGAALYASRAITLGTLFAVLLSTSDEMLPLFIAAQVDPAVMAQILGAKIVIGMIMGFVVDGAVRLRVRARLAKEQQALAHGAFAHDDCACSCHHPAGDHEGHGDHHESAHDHAPGEECCAHDHACASHRYEKGTLEHHADGDAPFSHEHCHNHGCHCDAGHSSWKDIALEALKHTAEVSVIVYVISLALVAVMEVFGEEALAQFLAGNPGFAIVGAALVGLIPNCGASVVICELYLDGMLGTGAMMAGLLVSAGVGLLVLFGENRRARQNLAILGALLATGIIWGALFEAAGIAFL